MKAAPNTESHYEVWFNRDLGKGVGRHLKADNETQAFEIADGLEAEGQPNIEVLKVTTTRKAVKPPSTSNEGKH